MAEKEEMEEDKDEYIVISLHDEKLKPLARIPLKRGVWQIDEAIHRMEIAMHNELIKRNLKDLPCDFRNYAEAALNALLSEDK
ncbi:MAG: hypothetical protein II453_03455 [Alphaproteobacteria bacterium]|nr:hypothetical protein [Alphaproteobacteria bacterium]